MKEKKERNGIKHFRHACRCFEPSEEEERLRMYIELVLGGMTKAEASREAKISQSNYWAYIIPSKELWDILPEKGAGSKWTYIKKMQSFSTAKRHPKRYREMMLYLIEAYLDKDYTEIKRKADKFDALINLIR